MATRNCLSTERTRTKWKPAMERYFIDLMLDQMHRGNRIGHTFTGQAWTDMRASFNAKFGTKYDRDILKSHYANLWKQYCDVKNLLEQDGFSWDDDRKMVIADDDAWDAFLNAHPDSQWYRRRPLMNFNDMSLIYTYTEADGRYSRSSHDIDLDDDFQGVARGSIPPETTSQGKTNWTPAMDRFFIELMLDQLRKGNKTDSSFSKQAWKDMLSSFCTKFGSQYGKSFLKRRYRKLFKYYNEMRSVHERKGSSLDENQQKVLDHGAWVKYIQAHPNISSCRNKALLNYQDLSLIYGNEIIKGQYCHIPQCENSESGGDVDTHFIGGSDRILRHWTIAMDNCLIDLLQDHALRGNKIGCQLTQEAWLEITRFLNAKFRSQFHEDILRRRYSYFRKQYSCIRFLLQHNGFSWDEDQQKIKAEGYVWDYHTRVYPDVRSYRDKSVLSYRKLCVIYGEESVVCNGSRAANLENAGQDLVTGRNSHANGNCHWTPPMERYFIDLMLKHVCQGNKNSCRLDSQAWLNVAMLFLDQFGVQLEKEIFQTHHESLAKFYDDVNDHLVKSGFSWDETEQLVMAYDDVWESYSKGNPDANACWSKPGPDYNDLHLIYGTGDSDVGNGSGPETKLDGGPRTVDWTPDMDRFFIDMMLVHVQHGSISSQNFSNLAWKDMVKKFTAEFDPFHNEDVLKSRFVYLMKQFNDMKLLLDQSGFSWDEMQQRIRAEDCLWTPCLQEYPGAQSYCSKDFPNFNDLFLIFGDPIRCGWSGNSDDSMSVNDYVFEHDSADKDDIPSTSCHSPDTNWTNAMEEYFIELMLQQIHKEIKFGETFTERTWSSIIKSFNEKFDLVCDKDDAESWYIGLMEECASITNLVNHNGFAWDDSQQRVIANDIVWACYLQDHPSAIKYKDRTLPNYNALCLIYGHNTLDTEINGGSEGSVYANGEYEISDRRKRRRKSASKSPDLHRKKSHRAEDDAKQLTSIEAIVDALQEIPGMNDALFLDACGALEDEEKAEAFVAMDVDERKIWLLRKLGL